MVNGERLAPCPWCDTNEELEVSDTGVQCPNCGCAGPLAFSNDGAVAAWNRRSPDPVLRELRLILTDIVARGHVDRAVAARETLRVIDGLEVLHGRKVP